MTVKFLDKDIELKKFNIRQADEVQALMIGDSDITSGEVKASITNFKQSQYLAVEYGTKDKSITRDYLQDDLDADQATDVQELYDEIMKLNGQA